MSSSGPKEELQSSKQSYDAQLRTIPISRLLNDDKQAITTLIDAGVQDGFFYVDLRAAETQSILDASAELTQLAEGLFDLPKEALAKFDLDVIGPSKIDGYKPAGRNTGVAAGKQDGFEIHLTSTNKLLGLSPSEGMPYPDLLAKHNDSLAFFVEKCHWLGTILLERFSAVLCHRHAVSLQQNHRYGKPSTSALGLLKYPATAASAIDKLGQIAHTDVGSITVLFAQLGGLQVLGNKGEWEFVQPKPGHAVINIGDSLRFLTGKRLRSSLHRVVPHPDASHRPRYSLAYFMRPEYDAQFEDEDGAQWTGLGWHTRKFAVFRASVEQQKNDSVLTGRKGYLGLWKEGTNGERELPA